MLSHKDRHYTHSDPMTINDPDYVVYFEHGERKFLRKRNTFREKLVYFPDRLVKHVQKPSVICNIPKDIYFLKKIKCFNSWSGKNFTKQ